MAVLSGPVYVPNPTPQTLRYGLFTVAVGPMDLPAHAGDGGVTWLSTGCGTAEGYPIICIDSPIEKGPFTEGMANPTATPFSVITGFECAPVGLSETERTRFALEKLQAAEQSAVEEIFSLGTFDQEPSLANNTPAATALAGSANLAQAFSRLEAAFYETYHYPGVIHLPFSAGAIALGGALMTMQGRIWRTPLGTAVSIGNYAGVSPVGVAPAAGSEWIYITPPVAIWRASEAFVTPVSAALDRTTNELTMMAEREYVVAYDNCEVFATEAVLLEGI